MSVPKLVGVNMITGGGGKRDRVGDRIQGLTT